MRSKQIIFLLIIIVALSVAGVFAYKAFFGNNSSNPSTKNSETIDVSGAILPHGNSLNFDNIKKYNKNGTLFPYPTVTPNDIGHELNDIVNL